MASNNPRNTSASSNLADEMLQHIMIDIYSNTQGQSIYRIPSYFWKSNEDAYTPQLVSIGPLHYGQKRLYTMQNQKRKYCNLFLDRANNMKAIDSFKEFLRGKEDSIRHCYYTEELCHISRKEKLCKEENLCHISTEKFVEMMMLDSIFIMELFLRIQRNKSKEEPTYSDIILGPSWESKNIQRDLILLENQIPMFILTKLYDNVVPETDKYHPTFIELAYDYFDCYNPYEKDYSCSDQEGVASSSSNGKSSKDNNTTLASSFEKKSSRFTKLKQNWFNNYEPQHFTDLIRSFYICKDHNHFSKGGPLSTATKLQEAGVCFETVTNGLPFYIRFQKHQILSWFLCLACIPKFKIFEARLEIPQLRIDHTTECILRNIMTFEQCHYPNQPYVCNFVSLFDSLIRSKEDVNLLVEKEVIVHTLRSDTDVVILMHGLVKNVVTEKTCFAGTIKALNEYYTRMWWNRSMVEMRSVYFRDLWRASSTIIGLVVFMFTILNIYQTIHGFYVVKN